MKSIYDVNPKVEQASLAAEAWSLGLLCKNTGVEKMERLIKSNLIESGFADGVKFDRTNHEIRIKLEGFTSLFYLDKEIKKDRLA